jgi:hypothetical protein
MTGEQDVAKVLEAIVIRHRRPTPEELAEVDRRVAEHERPEDDVCLDIHDAGDDPGVIPPREWLLGNQFCCGFISSIVAAGGTGKSALRLLQFISLALGRPLCGQHVFRRCRVLLISLEDDADELKRRIAAVLLHYGIAHSELKGWLFWTTPKLTKLAEMAGKTRSVGPLIQQIKYAIECHDPDLVSLDPFVKTHSLEENDSGDMDFVCDLLAGLAIEYGIAVDSHRTIIHQWLDNGVLIPKDYDSPGERKPRKGLTVVEAKRPGGGAPLDRFQWRTNGAKRAAVGAAPLLKAPKEKANGAGH